ncbi:MAG: SDR family NAD(P)-dependent oxidoreductase [Myxococcota bacterium]
MSDRPICAIVGVGPGNGEAFAREMTARGYRVARPARRPHPNERPAGELAGGLAVACDVTDESAIQGAFATIRQQAGPVDALLYNAGSGVFGHIEATSAADMEAAWRINTLGLYHCAQQCLEHMKAQKKGAIVVTGATASLRGGAGFAAFASAKAAQRSLASSMARHLGPLGIHVAIVIVDGIIRTPQAAERFSHLGTDQMLEPKDIARAVSFLVEQPPSAWTFELDLRPAREKW